MTKNTVGWFGVREKYCSLAKKVRLISQTSPNEHGVYLYCLWSDTSNLKIYPNLWRVWRTEMTTREERRTESDKKILCRKKLGLYPDYNPTPPHVSLLVVKLTHANQWCVDHRNDRVFQSIEETKQLNSKYQHTHTKTQTKLKKPNRLLKIKCFSTTIAVGTEMEEKLNSN